MSKWSRLLDVYDEVETDDYWEDLRQPGVHLVRGDGPESAETAKVMVVGQNPGATENGAGRPFVGPSGRVLHDLMGLAGLPREKCFITNAVKYYTPGNRAPSLPEAFHGQEALRKEFTIIRPRLTLLIGRTAHDVMSPDRGLWNLGTSVHAGVRWYKSRHYDGYQYVQSMYHPSFLMRGSKARQEAAELAWEELGKWIKESIPEVLDVA